MQLFRIRQLLTALMILHAIGGMTAYAGVGDQTAKLLPHDGAANDTFGKAVAISGSTSIVGAPNDDDNGNGSGSAYLYDGTGTQIGKLTPTVGAAIEQFGTAVGISGNLAIIGGGNVAYLFNVSTQTQIAKLVAPAGAVGFGQSVAIDGNIAIVGAHSDDENGAVSGAAFLFNASTGVQLHKLTPDDPAVGDQFGKSVSISGTIAVVGAPRDDDNGSSSGSAYIFDTTSGNQTDKLTPSNSAANNQFGVAVAISGGTIIVGAYQDGSAALRSTLGSTSGAAFLFNSATGSEIVKLEAEDGTSTNEFGAAVAISGHIAIVGAYYDDNNGSYSGAAYLFDVSGSQVAKLLPNDGAASDQFGRAVAIGDASAVVGARYHGDPGAAYLFASDADTDGDGLLDTWETLGVPYISAGGAALRFTLPFADPMHKNLYVEIDLDASQSFSLASRQSVIDAFAQSPVTNPDLIDGVNLHILHDETAINAGFFTTYPNGHADAGWAVEFDGLKGSHFGTTTEQGNAPLLVAKAKAYRYCILADTIDDGSLGTAELPGNDMFLTLGESTDPVTDSLVASTFMHEFGHTLGLGHGGSDGTNGKPNYISIMNYVLADPYDFSEDFWVLDYSRSKLPTLNETSMNEDVGVNVPDAQYADISMPFGVDVPDGSGGFNREIRYVSLAQGQAVDWNNNGTVDDPAAEQDLNYMGAGAPFADVEDPSPSLPLVGHDDWANLEYAIGTTGDYADLIHNSVPKDKINQAMKDWINITFPPPPAKCAADTNGDAMVNITDLLQLLASWGPCPAPCASDINDDGDVNVTDLLALLSAWGVCP